MKARSEFLSRSSPGVLWLMNGADGGVFETIARFQIASPASNQPGRSPTRGSGLGADADIPGEIVVVVDVEAHAAVSSNRAPSVMTERRDDAEVMADWFEGPTSCACGRSR